MFSQQSEPKKNYTLRFYHDAAYGRKDKIDFFNMEKESKWVVKGNWIDYSNEEKIWSDTDEYKISNTGEIVSGDGYVTDKIYIPEGTTTVTLKKLGGNYTWIGLESFAEDDTVLYYADQSVAELSFNIADSPTKNATY